MLLKIDEIVKATKGKIISKSSDEVTKIVTDSRLTDEKSLFVPLLGENFDAHDFLEDVEKNGCKAVLTSKDYKGDLTVIKVEDTKKALGDIARYYIKKLNPVKVAVTGSVGKTTTKDMIASVLCNLFPTLKTNGNFNNDIGVPLTAFRLEDEKVAVFEMGMNHFKEIEYLSEIVCPDISVITNIGHSHIENLGSREGILKAKLEILKGMNKDSCIILNGDDELLYNARDLINIKTIYYGINNKNCDILAEDIIEEDSKVKFKIGGFSYTINTPGIHNVYNALCAITVGMQLTDDKEKIKEGLMNFKPEGIRQNIIKKDNFTIISDCYNAAPNSMIASLDVLKKTKGKRKIAVFGSVLELGKFRDELLEEVGRKVKEYDVDELITVTEDALCINKGAKDSGFLCEKNFKDNMEVLNYLKANIKDDDVILIKGSRKYKMEEISEGLLK